MPGSVPNLRDLGRTRTADGRLVRPGVLLRSGLPFDDDEVVDVAWPPALVVDLRSAPEVLQHASLSGPPQLNVSLLSSLKPEAHLDGTLIALYGALLESAADLLVQVVQAVADTDGAVLLHCSAGKDRTGISIALVLRLLGVDRETVLADYVLTNESLEQIDARLRALAGNERRDELPREYFHVVPDALERVMNVWDAHPGGTEGWLLDAGAEPDLVDRLRARLLDSE